VRKHVVQYYVPFLPLEESHVRCCVDLRLGHVATTYKARGVASFTWTGDVLYRLAASDLHAYSERFSVDGCKHVKEIVESQVVFKLLVNSRADPATDPFVSRYIPNWERYRLPAAGGSR
jgi:hypothetical protein